MSQILNVQDRQEVFDYILSISQENPTIVSFVQGGSGSYGHHNEKSDLDFVIVLDSGSSMSEVMDYINEKRRRKHEAETNQSLA